MNNAKVVHMENIVQKIAKVVCNMCIFRKMLRLQENMTVYIWQIAVAVNTQKKQFVKLYFYELFVFLVSFAN